MPQRVGVLSAAIATLLGSLMACVDTTDTGKAGVPIVGNWAYIAVQNTPATATLAGAFVISSQTGSAVNGTLDVLETDQRGIQRRLSGPIAGRTVDSTTVDFDQVLGDNTRRHVGVVRRDSLTGSWVELPTTGGTISASGTFRAHKKN